MEQRLPWQVIIGRWFGGAILWWWSGWVVESASGSYDFPLALFSCLQKWQFEGLSEYSRESQVYVVEGGFPRISARG